MATPNIVSVATINGFAISGAVTTSDTDIITVPSDYVYKLNTLMISNIDGTNTATVSIKITTDNASTFYEIGPAIPIPARTVLTFIGKDQEDWLLMVIFVACTISLILMEIQI